MALLLSDILVESERRQRASTVELAAERLAETSDRDTHALEGRIVELIASCSAVQSPREPSTQDLPPRHLPVDSGQTPALPSCATELTGVLVIEGCLPPSEVLVAAVEASMAQALEMDDRGAVMAVNVVAEEEACENQGSFDLSVSAEVDPSRRRINFAVFPVRTCDVPAAAKRLQLEADHHGALSLLPQLVERLDPARGHCRLQIELGPDVVPRIQTIADDPRESKANDPDGMSIATPSTTASSEGTVSQASRRPQGAGNRDTGVTGDVETMVQLDAWLDAWTPSWVKGWACQAPVRSTNPPETLDGTREAQASLAPPLPEMHSKSQPSAGDTAVADLTRLVLPLPPEAGAPHPRCRTRSPSPTAALLARRDPSGALRRAVPLPEWEAQAAAVLEQRESHVMSI